MTSSFAKLVTRLLVALAAINSAAFSQTVSKAPVYDNAPACDQQRALSLIRQQVDEAKSFDDPVAQISTMIRAADLLWLYQQESARKIFAEGYDLAAENFEQQQEAVREVAKGVFTKVADQRFVVINAVARRDAGWARRLAERAAEETRRGADKAAASSSGGKPNMEIGGEMASLASSLLPANKDAALAVVRSSFRHPASMQLLFFLFEFAKTDQTAADQLYREALSSYANRTAEDLLYLSVYPFALNREVGPVRAAPFYRVPENFVANPQLQQILLEALFAQVERKLKTPDQPDEASTNVSESQRLLAALFTLEPLIAQRHPAHLQRAAALKGMLSVASSRQAQEKAEGFVDFARETEADSHFENIVKKIERETDPAKRDQAIAHAVLKAPDREGLARAESFLEKISDQELRGQLLGWLYFQRTQQAVKDGLLDEAARMSERVEELDYRALLALEIATAALDKLADRGRAGELLDAVVKAAQKAPDTGEKARALLGVAHLYTKFDILRSFEVMKDAVKTINALTKPDFTTSSILRDVRGKTFMIFVYYSVPGVSLENAFRELGASDFAGALPLAQNFEDKSLRATAIIALSSRCLEKTLNNDRPVEKQSRPDVTSPRKERRPKPSAREEAESPLPQ